MKPLRVAVSPCLIHSRGRGAVLQSSLMAAYVNCFPGGIFLMSSIRKRWLSGTRGPAEWDGVNPLTLAHTVQHAPPGGRRRPSRVCAVRVHIALRVLKA